MELMLVRDSCCFSSFGESSVKTCGLLQEGLKCKLYKLYM